MTLKPNPRVRLRFAPIEEEMGCPDHGNCQVVKVSRVRDELGATDIEHHRVCQRCLDDTIAIYQGEDRLCVVCKVEAVPKGTGVMFNGATTPVCLNCMPQYLKDKRRE